MAKPGQGSQFPMLPTFLNTSLRAPPLPPGRNISKTVPWKLVKCCICLRQLNHLSSIPGSCHMWTASTFILDCWQLRLLLSPPHRRHWDPYERWSSYCQSSKEEADLRWDMGAIKERLQKEKMEALSLLFVVLMSFLSWSYICLQALLQVGPGGLAQNPESTRPCKAT